MKMLWCWRCRMEVPMLDEDEFKIAKELYSQGFRITREQPDKKLTIEYSHLSIENRFKSLLDYYNQLTGWNETIPNAIMHHAIAQYGEPCVKCGKPLRTPQASYCPSCGNKK